MYMYYSKLVSCIMNSHGKMHFLSVLLISTLFQMFLGKYVKTCQIFKTVKNRKSSRNVKKRCTNFVRVDKSMASQNAFGSKIYRQIDRYYLSLKKKNAKLKRWLFITLFIIWNNFTVPQLQQIRYIQLAKRIANNLNENKSDAQISDDIWLLHNGWPKRCNNMEKR